MSTETASNIRIMSFKNILASSILPTFLTNEPRLNLIILDLTDPSSQPSSILDLEPRYCNDPRISYWKLPNTQGFSVLYCKIFAMNRRSYFLIAGPLGHPTLLPLLNHGNNMTSPSDLPEFLTNFTPNLQKIQFIIFHHNPNLLLPINYLHPHVALVTCQLEPIIQLIEEELQRLYNINRSDLSSSQSDISENTETVFQNQLTKYQQPGILMSSILLGEEKHIEEVELLKKIDDTPGVGSYDVINEPFRRLPGNAFQRAK